MRLRFFRLFLKANRPTVRTELDYAIAFRVAYLIRENTRAVPGAERIAKEIEFSVKDIVAQNQTGARGTDKPRGDQECFGDSLRLWLFGVIDSDSQLQTIAQIVAKHRTILRRRDDQDLAQSAEHQRRQRITDHRFVVNRQQLFADDLGKREKPAAGAACEDDGLLSQQESGKPHVFAGIHLEIQAERISHIRFDDFLHELHENRILPENGELVHRFEIDRDEERPLQLGIHAFAAFNVEHLRDLEQLHASVHHYLLDTSGSDLGLELVKDDVVNHWKVKAIRRYRLGAEVTTGTNK